MSLAPYKQIAVVDTIWFREKLFLKGLTQRGMAKHAGLDPSAVSLALAGRRHVTIQEASLFSEFLLEPFVEVAHRFGSHLLRRDASCRLTRTFVWVTPGATGRFLRHWS